MRQGLTDIQTPVERHEISIDFDGRPTACQYAVNGSRITVTVQGMVAMANLKGADARDLAVVLARELLLGASS